VKYRVITFLTLKGKQKFVDLGDQSYGEWILYEKNEPKFYVSSFDESSESNKLTNNFIVKDGWTIGKIINEINDVSGRKFHLQKKPRIEIIFSNDSVNLNLESIPLNWLKRIKLNKIGIKKLNIFREYNGEQALLDEPWADKNILDKISIDEFATMESIDDNLTMISTNIYSKEMVQTMKNQLEESKKLVTDEVYQLLKNGIKKK
jgi:hypothetical protein